MNYHVFIVDKHTFKYHLEYMFAGTGAGDKAVPFLSNSKASVHSATERNLVGMIADISRVRKGDKIIFYIQAADGNPGMFFGVFSAASTAFFDENDSKNYLVEDLQKPLTFRIKIAPDCVYPIGISEHDYLDSLKDIKYPFQMCWSLIYRKLKGNRGCTMITDYEFEALVKKIKAANNQRFFNKNSNAFSFDSNSYTIKRDNDDKTYTGRKVGLDIKDRMLFKANKQNAFEVHLQAFIMQNFDREPLKSLLIPYSKETFWIGNEVSCGVGMQRIDTMIIQEKENEVFIKIIELKCIAPYIDILSKQLPWYISWVTDYVAPNYTTQKKKVHIIPCVIASNSKNTSFINECRLLNHKYANKNNITVEPAEYIGFDILGNDIEFQKII